MTIGILAMLILLHWRFVLTEDLYQEPGSWTAYLIAAGDASECSVSLLSRTLSQKAVSTDLLVTLADCVMTKTKNGVEKVNPSDLRMQFVSIDSNGDPDQQFNLAISEVLYENDQKSSQDHMAILKMVENVTDHKGLQPLIVSTSKPSSYEKCSVAGFSVENIYSGRVQYIPGMYRIELTNQTCNNSNTTDQETVQQINSQEVRTGTPILCNVDSEDGPQVQGFIKETLEIHPHEKYSLQCIANTNFYNWTKRVLEQKLI